MAGPTSYVAERFAVSIPAGSKIDREKGVIEGVRVVGPKSRNGRKYPGEVLARHAGLFAAPVNVGHHYHPETFLPLPVPPEQRFGRVEAPTPGGDGVHGRLRFNPKHPFAEPFAWAAENDPGQFSFSPLMQVRWQPKPDADGDRVAESILEVASVDIVSDGGTTATIFESRYVLEQAMKADPKAIAGELETPGAILDFISTLMTELKTKDIPQPMKDAILSAVTSALSGAAEPPPAGADAAAMAPAMECLSRMGRVGKWAAEQLDTYLAADRKAKRDQWAADLIKTEAVAEHLVTPLFVGMVAESFGNEPRAKEIIADRKKLAGGNPARGNAPRTPPAGDKTVTVKDLVDGYAAG